MTTHVTISNKRGRASKETIVTAATHLFAAQGFRGTSLSEIASSVGITTAGLLYHFPHKEDVLFAVLDRHAERGAARLSAASTAGPSAVLGTLREIAMQNVADPEWVRLFSGILGESIAEDHPAHEYMRSRYARIAGILSDSLAVVEPNQERRAAITRLLNAAMDGLQFQWLLDPTLEPMRDLEFLIDQLVPAQLDKN